MQGCGCRLPAAVLALGASWVLAPPVLGTAGTSAASRAVHWCSGGDLAGRATRGADAGRSRTVVLVLRNRGRRACSVDGRPRLRFVEQPAVALATVIRPTGRAGPVRLSPGAHAHVTLSYRLPPAGGAVPLCARVVDVILASQRIDPALRLSARDASAYFALCRGTTVGESPLAPGV